MKRKEPEQMRKKNHGGNKCKNKKMEIIKTNPPVTSEIGRRLYGNN